MNAVAIRFSTLEFSQQRSYISQHSLDIPAVAARDARVVCDVCTISGHGLVEWLHSIEFQGQFLTAFFIDAKLQERYNTLVL